MSLAVERVRRAGDLPVGVNVLRNDAIAAVSIAAVCGAAFVRVNVLSGSVSTDQGVITGRAAEVARLRRALDAPVAILADVFVKHAAAPEGIPLAQAARDTFQRAGADGLIVTGAATGWGASADAVAEVKDAVPEAPVYVGSGVTAETVAGLLETADGVIVGTALKEGAVTTAPVDLARARRLVAAAR
jgi:membrane complex biogenesis BtpA family protein